MWRAPTELAGHLSLWRSSLFGFARSQAVGGGDERRDEQGADDHRDDENPDSVFDRVGLRAPEQDHTDDEAGWRQHEREDVAGDVEPREAGDGAVLRAERRMRRGAVLWRGHGGRASATASALGHGRQT